MELDMFYKVMDDEISIEQFEQWLYATDEIENLWPSDDYVAMISIDYRRAQAKDELKRLLERLLDPVEFEYYKITTALKNIVAKSPGCGHAILRCYRWYCRGYRFLAKLGLGYGLYLANAPYFSYGKGYWSDLTEGQQDETLNRLYPDIIAYAQIVLDQLLAKKIVLTGQAHDRFGEPLYYYEYIDKRSEGEKTRTDHD